MDAKINIVKRLIRESKYLVCICGGGMLREIGHHSLRDPERAYDIEARYGYSPEEMFSSAFYNTRTEPFYKFYKQEVLSEKMEPGAAFLALARLEEEGILKTVITNNIYAMPKHAGCKNILEPHGNIEKNKCPHCQKPYSKEYLLNAKKVPLCEECMKPIRPGIRFYGEQIDNGIMTQVATEITKADVLMVLGTRLDSDFCDNYLSYYKGKRLILINNIVNYTDEKADYVIHGVINEIVPRLLEEENREDIPKMTEK